MSVWYDGEGDMLEVLWADREECFVTTNDARPQAAGRRWRVAERRAARRVGYLGPQDASAKAGKGNSQDRTEG